MMHATVRGSALPPQRFLQLAGHPLRWRLLTELGRSDRQVRELTQAVGQPQNLVSYHLARLRTAQLVTMRRSSADRRDAYYSVNLSRFGALLAAAGGAIHPGLGLLPSPWDREGRRSTGPVRVLFLCTGNSARSQMAEAFLQHFTDGHMEAFSAGSHPKRLHPNAVRAMREHGIDISGRRAKHMDEFKGQGFDYVISLCDRVREVCPTFPGRPEYIHWSFADPALAGDSGAQIYPQFRRTAAELAVRIRFLLQLVNHRPLGQGGN